MVPKEEIVIYGKNLAVEKITFDKKLFLKKKDWRKYEKEFPPEYLNNVVDRSSIPKSNKTSDELAIISIKHHQYRQTLQGNAEFNIASMKGKIIKVFENYWELFFQKSEGILYRSLN
jgi:hypothetical protein